MPVRNTKIERLLKPSEVCQILRVSRRTLTRLTAAGVLPFVRIAGPFVSCHPLSMRFSGLERHSRE